MTNAELFREIFGIYAEELWAWAEKEMLEWLNTDVPDKNVGDTISRQAAIDAVSEAWMRGAYYTETINAIKDLPSAEPEPQWIPCSERLPEYGEKCLVTAHAPDIDRLIIITSRCYVQKEGFWTDLPFTYKVTAWLPLPEAYKGGDEHE